MYYTKFKIDICTIILVGDEKGLITLYMETENNTNKFQIDKEWIYNDNFFKDIKNEIYEYFQGDRKNFTVKLNLKGTEFQKKVWCELQNIPYGEVRTYKDIAIKIGNPKGARAIGMANNKNPIPLIIPCHRVIGSNGNLTGFAFGINIKEKLINLEKLGE